ncbi:MAG TPA: biotin/lipoyl-containing protein [Ferruginibacter sp.]|nr:biotin/lipoyl-containing protein [Ferruginibacter sp.]
MNGKNITYKVKANEFDFTFSKEQINAVDIVKKSPTAFNVINEHRSVNVKLLEADPDCKKLTLEVDGESFIIEIKDELDLMLDKMGFGAVSNKHVKEIKAPMPGLVLEIAVTEGQEVKEGDKILILVAMKMENSIIIHTNAVIKRIAVTAGQAVDKGQLLVELD